MFDKGHDSAESSKRVGPEPRADNDQAVVTELIDWIGSGTGAAEARVFRLFGQSTSAFRTTLLNGLAEASAAGCPYALAVLLAIIDEYHLARPAIVPTGLTGADLADAEQATLIAVTRSIHGFQGDARFSTWLHRVARNTAIGEIRRQKPTVELDRPGLRPAPGMSQRRMSSVVAEAQLVEDLIDSLPDVYRTTVHLRDVERLSYGDIAERQSISINTVKSRLNRGRQLLASQWTEQARALGDSQQ